MRHELSDLLDSAKARIGAKSERELARALGVDPTSLLLYRRGENWPSDDRLIRICVIASVAPDDWLLRLNMWRSTGDARRRYGALLKKLGQQSLPNSEHG